MAKDGTPVTFIFAKHITNLIEALTKSSIYYPSRFAGDCGDHCRSYECKANECHKGLDGRWITDKLTAHNGRDRHPVAYNRFFWRIEPNYSSYGQPSYSQERIAEIFAKSETKKVIHDTGRHSIILEWFEFLPPTETCWGLRQGPVYVTIYNERDKRIWTGTKSIKDRGWKKEFTEFIVEYFKWDPTRKD
jgi:hypothetical protein